jgi:DNA-binding FadR family transcriptional regulator
MNPATVIRLATRPSLIAGELGRDILSGKLPEGALLPPETVLMDRWQVSRTTLREAFKILSAKGMVRARPKVGTVVCAHSTWSLLDPEVLGWLFEAGDLDSTLVELFDVRRMIETEAAGMAADMGSPTALARIRAAYLAMAAPARDIATALEADVAFHRAIVEATGNRFMIALATVSETALRTTVKLSVRRPGGLPFSLPQHEAVLLAIEARDAAAARMRMTALIEAAQSDAIEVGRSRLRDTLREAAG